MFFFGKSPKKFQEKVRDTFNEMRHDDTYNKTFPNHREYRTYIYKVITNNGDYISDETSTPEAFARWLTENEEYKREYEKEIKKIDQQIKEENNTGLEGFLGVNKEWHKSKILKLNVRKNILSDKIKQTEYINEFILRILPPKTIEGEVSVPDTSRYGEKLNRPTIEEMSSILGEITEEEYNNLTDEEKYEFRELQAMNDPIYEQTAELEPGTKKEPIRKLAKSIRQRFLDEEKAKESAFYDADGNRKGYHAKTHLFEGFAGGRKTKRRNKKHKKSNRRLHKKSNRRTRR